MKGPLRANEDSIGINNNCDVHSWIEVKELTVEKWVMEKASGCVGAIEDPDIIPVMTRLAEVH